MIKIRKLTDKGDEPKEVTVEKAEEMILAAEGRYFIVNAETKDILKECKLEDNMSLMFTPLARGG